MESKTNLRGGDMKKRPIEGATGKDEKSDNVRTGEDNLERKANAAKNIKDSPAGPNQEKTGDLKSSKKK